MELWAALCPGGLAELIRCNEPHHRDIRLCQKQTRGTHLESRSRDPGRHRQYTRRQHLLSSGSYWLWRTPLVPIGPDHQLKTRAASSVGNGRAGVVAVGPTLRSRAKPWRLLWGPDGQTLLGHATFRSARGVPFRASSRRHRRECAASRRESGISCGTLLSEV